MCSFYVFVAGVFLSEWSECVSVLTRSESSIASQAKGTDVIARVRQLSETVGDDPCVQAMSIDLLLERAELAKRQLIEAEGCVKGWVEAEYEEKRALTEKQMSELQKDFITLEDYHASMLVVKSENSAERSKEGKNFRGRRDTLAKRFVLGKVPKELAQASAEHLLKDGSNGEAGYSHFHPESNLYDHKLQDTTDFQQPVRVVYGDDSCKTHYHSLLNSAWNAHHGGISSDLPKASNNIAKRGKAHAYKVLEPCTFDVNPPASSDSAEETKFNIVAEVTPVMYVQQTDTYALPPPRAAALS